MSPWWSHPTPYSGFPLWTAESRNGQKWGLRWSYPQKGVGMLARKQLGLVLKSAPGSFYWGHVSILSWTAVEAKLGLHSWQKIHLIAKKNYWNIMRYDIWGNPSWEICSEALRMYCTKGWCFLRHGLLLGINWIFKNLSPNLVSYHLIEVKETWQVIFVFLLSQGQWKTAENHVCEFSFSQFWKATSQISLKRI